jgi:hypothetical protein
MRKYILLMGLVGTLILNACNKFLDVLPRTQIPEDNLFNTEQGFKDALTGVYISAKSNATYGKSLTFGTIENLVSSWDVTTNTLEQQLGLLITVIAGSLISLMQFLANNMQRLLQ